eukprot:NODE_2715_length_2159_cov_16.175689.p1 GENE.NODE_2715_length_2159_cov_16.175689~~NODE_2715_length_2159_cov_16.175689.p1  ORF type:complete len:395 (+),score=125.23 NODE_2715_length_2159_cov_16.175689:269-1453(+)
MFVGVGSSRVRDLFKQARNSAPSIIFIDEIDAIGVKRGASSNNSERDSTLNQLLIELDGFNTSTNVVVVAGTNRDDILDPALVRPGRFDRKIDVQKPDVGERKEIFGVHLQPLTIDKRLSVESIAQRLAALTPGFSGSEIANLCNESAIIAARRNADTVEMNDFERASERVLVGVEKSKSLMSAETKIAVAVHESGHAIAGWFLKHTNPLVKLSVVPRSKGTLGFAQWMEEDPGLQLEESLLDRIAVYLAGRAAEDVVLGKITSGATDDLDKASKIAYSMVSRLGMSTKVGLVSFADDSQELKKSYSEDTNRIIDAEVRDILDVQYRRVKALLLEHRPALDRLTEHLRTKETLVYAEIKAVLGERPYGISDEIRQFVEQANPYEILEESAAEAP